MTEPWKKYQGGANTAAAGPWEKYTPPAPAQERSFGQEMLRQGGLGARYMLEGFTAPIEIVANPINAAIDLGSTGINKVFGTDIPMLGSWTAARERAIKHLPSPQSPEERVIGDMSRFVAGAGGSAAVAKLGELAGTKVLAPLGQNLGAQALAAEAAGGAYGVAGEHTDNPWIKLGAAMLGGAAGGGVAAAAERLLPSNTVKPAIPATADIKAASQAAYKEAGEAGAIIRPEAMQKVNAGFRDWLSKFGFDPALQPKVAVLLDRLEKSGANNITAEGVDVLRKIAGNVARDGNPSERAIAGELIGQLDDMMDNLSPADVLQGNADDAARAFTKARDLWKTFRKAELIDNLLMKGEDQALSTNSGGNVQNAIRQKLRSILDNPRTARLFNKEEIDAIRSIVRGTPTQNALRIVGRLAPSSNSWLGPILETMGGGAGYAAGGLPGLATATAIPAIGAMSKAGATGLTKNAVGNLSNLVRSAAIPKIPPVAPTPVDWSALMSRALMQGTQPRPLNAYAEFLLRSGGAAAPASGNPGTGPQDRP